MKTNVSFALLGLVVLSGCLGTGSSPEDHGFPVVEKFISDASGQLTLDLQELLVDEEIALVWIRGSNTTMHLDSEFAWNASTDPGPSSTRDWCGAMLSGHEGGVLTLTPSRRGLVITDVAGQDISIESTAPSSQDVTFSVKGTAMDEQGGFAMIGVDEFSAWQDQGLEASVTFHNLQAIELLDTSSWSCLTKPSEFDQANITSIGGIGMGQVFHQIETIDGVRASILIDGADESTVGMACKDSMRSFSSNSGEPLVTSSLTPISQTGAWSDASPQSQPVVVATAIQVDQAVFSSWGLADSCASSDGQ